MSTPTGSSKAARIISSFFKPAKDDVPTKIPSTDEPEDRESPKKSFASNIAASIVRRLGK